MSAQTNKNFKSIPRKNRKINMEKIMITINENKNDLLPHQFYGLFRRHTKYMTFWVVIVGFMMLAPDVLAVGDAPDAGLSTGVTNLLAILNSA